jgi:hypothetical protein
MSRERLAVWATLRHVASKAAPYAIDRETQEAYRRVIAHAEERTEYFRRETSNATPVAPAPKSA